MIRNSANVIVPHQALAVVSEGCDYQSTKQTRTLAVVLRCSEGRSIVFKGKEDLPVERHRGYRNGNSSRPFYNVWR